MDRNWNIFYLKIFSELTEIIRKDLIGQFFTFLLRKFIIFQQYVTFTFQESQSLFSESKPRMVRLITPQAHRKFTYICWIICCKYRFSYIVFCWWQRRLIRESGKPGSETLRLKELSRFFILADWLLLRTFLSTLPWLADSEDLNWIPWSDGACRWLSLSDK